MTYKAQANNFNINCDFVKMCKLKQTKKFDMEFLCCEQVFTIQVIDNKLAILKF